MRISRQTRRAVIIERRTAHPCYVRLLAFTYILYTHTYMHIMV